MEALEAFFEQYRRALEAFDVEAVCAAYRVPLPVVRPDRVRVIYSRETLCREIGKILDFYRWAGMRRVEGARATLDRFEPGMTIMSATWRALDWNGAELALVDVTYAIRRGRDRARIACVVAHNEERHRVPIIRETLDALERGHDRRVHLRP